MDVMSMRSVREEVKGEGRPQHSVKMMMMMIQEDWAESETLRQTGAILETSMTRTVMI